MEKARGNQTDYALLVETSRTGASDLLRICSIFQARIGEEFVKNAKLLI